MNSQGRLQLRSFKSDKTTARTKPLKFTSISFFHVLTIFFLILIIGSTIPVQGLQYYDVDLATPDVEKDADKKQWAYYDIRIINTGEKDDTYQVTYDNPKADTWGVAYADYIEDRIEITVKAAESAIVNLSVHPSCGCQEGQNLYVNLTVRSQGESDVFDKIMVVTTYITQNSNPDPNGDPVSPDSDGDGWTDDEEQEYGTNPWDADDYPFLDRDSDNDGLSDAAEATWGTNPNNPDTDGDSYSDGDELEQGSDPLDPESKPRSADQNGDDDTSGDNDEKNIFGLSTGDGMYAYLIPLLVIIVLVSVIILFFIWRSGEPDKDDDDDDDDEDDPDFNGRSLEPDVTNVKDDKKLGEGSKSGKGDYEILAAKLKRSGGGMYECPQCDNEFNLKDLKKHVLRKHHKRLKRL